MEIMSTDLVDWLISGGGRGGGGGSGVGGHMPPGAGRGGAPSGCNYSKLSKQILTRNERIN